MTKVGRNDPCPCGSGKKFKKCCEQKTPTQRRVFSHLNPQAPSTGMNKISGMVSKSLESRDVSNLSSQSSSLAERFSKSPPQAKEEKSAQN